MAALVNQGEDGKWHLLDRSETVYKSHGNFCASGRPEYLIKMSAEIRSYAYISFLRTHTHVVCEDPRFTKPFHITYDVKQVWYGARLHVVPSMRGVSHAR